MDSSPPGRLRLPALQAFRSSSRHAWVILSNRCCSGIGFLVWPTTFAGAKASGERLTGISVEDVFPQSMPWRGKTDGQKDACGTHGENEFAVGIRVRATQIASVDRQLSMWLFFIISPWEKIAFRLPGVTITQEPTILRFNFFADKEAFKLW